MGSGGIWLVLGEAQVERAAALQGLSPQGTPTSWPQALQSERRRCEARSVRTILCLVFPSPIPTGG